MKKKIGPLTTEADAELTAATFRATGYSTVIEKEAKGWYVIATLAAVKKAAKKRTSKSAPAQFNKQPRSFDVRPDRYDVRDRTYQPKLVNLPPIYPTPALTKTLLPAYKNLVLDQGTEGACTGFGLAAMINYLRFRQAFFPDPATGKSPKKPALPHKVSPRMLYAHARLYDEWPGEDYDGSSCRGAMKGWHRHGVCLEKTWPYLQKGKSVQPGKPKANWAVEAAEIALGSYYRVETDDITAMQSAIHEVGALYASADVHGGWDLAGEPEWVGYLPVIAWKSGTEPNGGHAFALVGYNPRGFIVQNSWNHTWGYNGFALLTYEDWLANTTDAWVATMGVPVCCGAVPTNYSSQAFNRVSATFLRAGKAGAPASTIWSEDEARSHALVLGNDGVLLRGSAAYDAASFVDEVLMENLRAWLKVKTNRKIAIYAHGGLNHEEDAIQRIRVMAPNFKANGIFPIFIVWKTGWKESLLDIGVDMLNKFLPVDFLPSQGRGLGAWLKDKVCEGADYTVETTLGFLGKSLWRQMKQNAVASGDAGRGGDILALALSKLKKQFPTAEVHLIGHSAGSIWHGHWLSTLRRLAPSASVASCHLYAAACTVPFANEHYGKAIKAKFLPGSNLWIHNLSEEAERADNVGGFYGKSLLYFVSRACEEAHKTPILGMEAIWNDKLKDDGIFHEDFEKDVGDWRDLVKKESIPAPIHKQANESVNDGRLKNPPSHGGFDNDIAIITRTLNRILGQADDATLPYPVTSLAGF